ncbi:hypothetical protein D3C87_2015360 [compost metagenome]
MIMEDKKLEEMKLYKKELDRIIKKLKNENYKLYVYTYLKYLHKGSEKQTKENIKQEEVKNLDHEVMKYFRYNIKIN